MISCFIAVFSCFKGGASYPLHFCKHDRKTGRTKVQCEIKNVDFKLGVSFREEKKDSCEWSGLNTSDYTKGSCLIINKAMSRIYHHAASFQAYLTIL